jgi:hypothetical protein
MKKLALAAAAVAALAAASTTDVMAFAGFGCPPWMCNGPQLTGIALPPVKSQQPIVNAVTLPSGETVALR